MEPLNGLSHSKIALLIDFDNVLLGIDDPGFDVELVVNALRERGTIVMGRCYGDWYRHNRHRRKLMEQGLELVETPAFGPVIKNSADIRIALDGLEIGMTQHHIDTFCLVSGDSDFLPLIKKLQYLGKQVLVICGNRFTSDMLRRNCNEFISYENLLAQSVGATEDATTLEGAFALLHRAMEALRERGAEIRSSTVKQMMLQLNPTFSERNFGCPQFRGFLDKAVAQGLIKLGGRDRVSGEFSVLLPEENDEIPAAERLEIKNPEVKPEIKNPVVGETGGREAKAPREPRAPRTPRESRLKTARENDAPTIAPPGSDLFAPATQTETDDHSTTTSSLISRGLRRGKLRFSGKSGKPEKIEAPFEEIFGIENAPTSPESETVPESAILMQNAFETDSQPIEIAPEVTASDDLNELSQQVAQIAAQISVGTQDAPEIPVAPALEAALAAKSEADGIETETAKKPARRRRSRSKSSGGEKGVTQTAPETEEIAAQNEADADAIGLSFPGHAFEIGSDAPPEALAELASQPVIESPEKTVAATPDVTVESETPVATSAEETTESATVEAEAEAPKKPVRRRRSPRKKADETPAE